MCQSSQSKSTMQQQQQQSNMYPNLSEFYNQPGGQNQAAGGDAAPLLQLLIALGLVPPAAEHAPSAPEQPAADEERQNAGSGHQDQQRQQQQEQRQQEQPSGSVNNQSGSGRQQTSANSQCPNCQHTQQQTWRWEWPSCSQWSWPPSASNTRPSQPPPACNPDIAAFLCGVFTALERFFRTSTRLGSLFFFLMMVHLFLPRVLLQNVVFGVLAAGLGLHLPTLLAGQVLWCAVGCLRMFEPFFLAGLLVFAVHKMLVRREPLVDQQFWRNRFNNFVNDNRRQN